MPIITSGKLLVKIGRSLIMFILQVFTDDGIFMLLDAQVEVMACVAYIIWITRITLKFIHNASLVYKWGLHEQFTTLKKCRGKFECLIYEMLLIRKKRPPLNTQNDSIPAKRLFKNFSHFFLILLFINASFIVMYFLTYYFPYNGHYLVIICIW